ncbi:hypothetical protein STEG23_025000 [Scotinomys teguina]
MSAVMLLPGTNGSLLLVQRTVTRTIVLQETIGKVSYEKHGESDQSKGSMCSDEVAHISASCTLFPDVIWKEVSSNVSNGCEHQR